MRRPNTEPIVSDQCVNEYVVASADKEMIGLSFVPLLALAEQRITSAQLDALDALCAALPEHPTTQQMTVFRSRYWNVVASATRNAILQARVRALFRRSCGPSREWPPPLVTRSEYRKLSQLLRAGAGAVEFWLTVLEPVFGATEASLRLRARSPQHI